MKGDKRLLIATLVQGQKRRFPLRMRKMRTLK